jgi:hypothetical protein
MGATEIKSPEVLPVPPVGLEENSVSDAQRRKKLGNYFIESDDRRTAFGGGYIGGATPVNIPGKPISNLSKTGGWIAAFLIFGTSISVYPLSFFMPKQEITMHFVMLFLSSILFFPDQFVTLTLLVFARE